MILKHDIIEYIEGYRLQLGKDVSNMHDNLDEIQSVRLVQYRILNRLAKKGNILFTGSSLMEQFPINELLMNNGMHHAIYNRGIGGFTTDNMLEYMDEMVFGTEPARVFINIGTNDIARPDYSLDRLIRNYEKILILIRDRLPDAEINTLAYFPVNETDKVTDNTMRDMLFSTRTNENIDLANMAVEALAKRMGCNYIDANEGLRDNHGRLKAEYTIEGIHMYANGYQVVFNNLRKYL